MTLSRQETESDPVDTFLQLHYFENLLVWAFNEKHMPHASWCFVICVKVVPSYVRGSRPSEDTDFSALAKIREKFEYR